MKKMRVPPPPPLEISSLYTGLCFFATLIENFPALIEKSHKILNLVFVSISTWTQGMISKETFSRDAAHIIDLQSYSCPRFFNCKTYEIYL